MTPGQPPRKPVLKGPTTPRPAAAPGPKRLAPTEEAAFTEDIALSASFAALKRRIVIQSWILVALGAFLIALLPFTRPYYFYHAVNPQKKTMRLTALDMPNITNRALLSWATTSITEVMTMGFGDIDTKFLRQRFRFTSKGWDDYKRSFEAMQIREAFRQRQLVLTTVPAKQPTIIGQGVDVDKVYKWIVEMPISMTYATNNNVTRVQKGRVMLKISRTPTNENPMGIAIERWNYRI